MGNHRRQHVCRWLSIIAAVFLFFAITQAAEQASQKPAVEVPISYENYDAIINGTISRQATTSPLNISGTFTNNYWESLCNINAYITVIRPTAEKEQPLRLYLGDLEERSKTSFQSSVPAPERVGTINLTITYEICSKRAQSPPEFISVDISWPKQE
ncbi:MAG: hypothetical protein JXO49_12130 [Deltaproteobacteria bacterium]|nr:hypothetical protein [Candidatus Anaeroferrophillus wilburensis]MBN2890081.1 hypothetical protein [Deltaproteobacteria bacterium]